MKRFMYRPFNTTQLLECFILCIINYDIYHYHFMYLIGSVTSIIVSSLTSSLLYCLPEDGHMTGRNL